MIKNLLFLVTMALLSFNANAQTSEMPYSIGLWGGTTQYDGDLGNGIYESGQATYAHFGLAFGYYITPRFDFALNATLGSIGYRKDSVNKFTADQSQLNIHFRFNILNSDQHKLVPYLLGGIGVSYMGGSEKKPGTDFFIPFGVGIKYRVTDRINLHLQETFAYTDHDTRDYAVYNNNDGFAMHSIGVTWNFAGMKDEDKDGICDKKDKCPATPTGIKVDENGCPLDRDGDMIADYLDSCPDVKGVASAKGCPDKDFDGIRDADDKCPDLPGTIAMKGCPDSDGDGIIDPDDACPNEKGLTAFKGCPDKDGDGIADKEDKCPDVPGIPGNKGCPEVKAEVTQLFTEALQGIQFESGKDAIRKSSYTILNNVAKVMTDNPAYLLSIDGHTDNTGNSVTNMVLSQERADAVKAYLTNKGISSSRMTATGFGQTVPVADNKTAAGRAKNRRVAFKVSF